MKRGFLTPERFAGDLLGSSGVGLMILMGHFQLRIFYGGPSSSEQIRLHQALHYPVQGLSEKFISLIIFS